MTIQTTVLYENVECDEPVDGYWAECEDYVWIEEHGPTGVVWSRDCGVVTVDPCWVEVTCEEMADRMEP